MVERYAYHQPHFIFIGKCDMAKDRNIYLRFGEVKTTRDYTEILKYEFDNEIMSRNFGSSLSL